MRVLKTVSAAQWNWASRTRGNFCNYFHTLRTSCRLPVPCAGSSGWWCSCHTCTWDTTRTLFRNFFNKFSFLCGSSSKPAVGRTLRGNGAKLEASQENRDCLLEDNEEEWNERNALFSFRCSQAEEGNHKNRREEIKKTRPMTRNWAGENLIFNQHKHTQRLDEKTQINFSVRKKKSQRKKEKLHYHFFL